MGRGSDCIDAMRLRVDGLEVAVDEAVPCLVGALVDFLSQKGVLSPAEFAAFLRGAVNPDLRLEDSAGHMIAELARLTEMYGSDVGRSNASRACASDQVDPSSPID